MALLAFLAFGVSGFLYIFIVGTLGPFYSLVLSRALTLPLIFFMAFREKNPGKGTLPLLPLAGIGLLDAGGFLAYNFGLLSGLVSIVSAVVSAEIFVAVVLAHLFLKERLEKGQYLGILFIVAGLVGLSLA